MAIYKLRSVITTGLLATTLSMGACIGPAGPQGTGGDTGARGATGAAGAPAPATTAPVAVTCNFDQDENITRDMNSVEVSVQGLDTKFDPIPGALVRQWGPDDFAGDVFTIDAPIGFNEVTCWDTNSGETLTSLVNNPAVVLAKATPALTVNYITDAVWEALVPSLSYNGYANNITWTNASMRALEAAAALDTTLIAAWTANSQNMTQLYADVRNFVSNNGAILQPFAKDIVCLASVMPAETFPASGDDLVTDISLGDPCSGFTDSVACAAHPFVDDACVWTPDDHGGDYCAGPNDGYQVNSTTCLLTEFNGFGASPVVTVNGLTSPAADTCKFLTFTDDRLEGVIGDAGADAITTGQSMEWYAVQLAYGTDALLANHQEADAVHYGAALNCSADTAVECQLELGSKIDVAPGTNGAVTVYCDDETDYSSMGDCAVNPGRTTAFVFSMDARAAQTNASVLWVAKKCAASVDVNLGFSNDGVDHITATIANDVHVGDAGEVASMHWGVVLAEVNPAETVRYQALERLALQNIAGDPVAAFATTRGRLYNLNAGESLDPYEVAIALASGNGLCEPRLVELSGGDTFLGAATNASPNIAMAGLPMGEEISIAEGDDPAEVVGIADENGNLLVRHPLGAGQSLVVTSGDYSETCTAPAAL